MRSWEERGVGEGTGGCREAEKQQSKVNVVVGGMRGFSRQKCGASDWRSVNSF